MAAENKGLRETWVDVEGVRIACDVLEGTGPTVVFLGGYGSSRRGDKAEALARWALGAGHSFIRFDYSGHGDSEGVFEHRTLGRWITETRAVIDSLTGGDGKLVLVGSSMGAWIALALAREPAYAERLTGLVTVACAADFTVDTIPALLGEEGMRRLRAEGVVYRPERNEAGRDGDELVAPLPFTLRFMEESVSHQVLDGGPITLGCPVRLLHGLDDGDIPWQTSLSVLERIEAPDATLMLVAGGDHRLSAPPHLEKLISTLVEVLRA